MRNKALILNHSNASLTQTAMSEYKLGKGSIESAVKKSDKKKRKVKQSGKSNTKTTCEKHIFSKV
jgi:hypothetical protein